MAYRLSWYLPEQILCLELEGQPSLEKLEEVNREVTAVLDQCGSKITLLMDATQLKTGYLTSNYLRDTQKYTGHPQLDKLMVVADNKLIRLITLMAFSVSRANFIQFNDFARAEDHLKRHGLIDRGSSNLSQQV